MPYLCHVPISLSIDGAYRKHPDEKNAMIYPSWGSWLTKKRFRDRLGGKRYKGNGKQTNGESEYLGHRDMRTINSINEIRR